MSPRELLRLLAAEMTAAGVPDADVDAGLLLSHVTGSLPLNLRMDSWSQVSPEAESAFRALCERRKTRTPLQYLTGVQSFLGRDFFVDERVLIPRPETELLAERAVEALRRSEGKCALDLCCGSGCLAVSLALGVPGAQVHAADLSPDALAVTGINADRLGASITRHQGDLFSALPEGLRFDVIVSNPPYIPAGDCMALQEEVRREPLMALDGGADGYDFYRRIAAQSPCRLNRGGTLLMEVGFDQAEGVMALCREAGFSFVTAHEDYQHILRMVEARL